MDSSSAGIIRRFAGQWVVWNRQQDRVISSGRTFEEAKQSAAAAGETSVILTKASSGTSRPHWLCAVAVFIALSPGALPASQMGFAAPPTTIQWCETEPETADCDPSE